MLNYLPVSWVCLLKKRVLGVVIVAFIVFVLTRTQPEKRSCSSLEFAMVFSGSLPNHVLTALPLPLQYLKDCASHQRNLWSLLNHPERSQIYVCPCHLSAPAPLLAMNSIDRKHPTPSVTLHATTDSLIMSDFATLKSLRSFSYVIGIQILVP